MPPKNRGDLRMLSAFRPCERRRPRLVIGKVRGRATLEQKLHHLECVRSRRPGERRGRELVIARRNVRTRVEQDAGLRDGAATVVRSAAAHEMQQSLMLPVHEVRTHAAFQQRAKHVRVLEQVTLAAREHGRRSETRAQVRPGNPNLSPGAAWVSRRCAHGTDR